MVINIGVMILRNYHNKINFKFSKICYNHREVPSNF